MVHSLGRTLRRPSLAVEVQGGMACAGREQRVVNGHDLVLLVENPQAQVRCRRRVDPLPPSLLALAAAGEVLTLELKETTPFRALYLAPGTLAATAVHRGGAGSQSPGMPRILAFVAAGSGLCEAADAVDGEESACRLVERILASWGCTVRAPADEPMQHAVVARVRDFLRERYRSRVTLADLARVSGMCRFALVRAFTREVGMPPHAYQTRLRVQAACELISLGRRLSDVALELGFTDQSHLNRHFKLLLGVTPGDYSRTCRPLRPKAQRGLN